ncbi:MAG: hypothetical protein GXO55_00200, partial [Chloroflexi bacterium]|nr:hypothetical protein [Chloroflexota bacterium]
MKVDEELLAYAIERTLEDPYGYDPLQDERIPQEMRAVIAEYVEPVRALARAPKPQPPAAAVHAARERMHRALAQQRSSLSVWRNLWDRLSQGLHRSLAPVTTVALTLVLLFTVGLGTYVLAMNAMPGQPLYPVKRHIENLSLRITSPQRAPLVHMELALRRLEEFDALLRQGIVEPELLDAYMAELSTAREAYEHLPPAEKRRVQWALWERLNRAEGLLASLLERVPDEVRPRVEEALAHTRAFRRLLTPPSPTSTPTPRPTDTPTPAPSSQGGKTPVHPAAHSTLIMVTPRATRPNSPLPTATPTFTPSPTPTSTPTPRPTHATREEETPTPHPTHPGHVVPTFTPWMPTAMPTGMPPGMPTPGIPTPPNVPTPPGVPTPPSMPTPPNVPTPPAPPTEPPTPVWPTPPTCQPTPTFTPSQPTSTPPSCLPCTPTPTWTSPAPTPTRSMVTPTST